jgi:protoheme ferro-lyase
MYEYCVLIFFMFLKKVKNKHTKKKAKNIYFSIIKFFYKKKSYENMWMSACISILVDYPLSGYLHEYGTNTNILFIQRSRHMYHIIYFHGCPFTSLLFGSMYIRHFNFVTFVGKIFYCCMLLTWMLWVC